MPRFLSPEWAEEFNAALANVEVPGPGPEAGLAAADGRFTVAQEIRQTPDGDVRLVLEVDAGRLHIQVAALEADPSGAGADVSIALTYEDAAAMSKGELAPAEALNAGRIRVRGDLSVLVAAQGMLDAARIAVGSLDRSTTY